MFTSITKPPFTYTKGQFDPYVTRLSEWVQSEFDENKMYDLALLGVPISKSSISFSGAHTHPEQFRKLLQSFTTYNFDEDIDLKTLNVIDVGDVKMHVTDILKCLDNIENAVTELSNKNKAIPIMIGGDHAITYPILKGLSKARNSRIGVIHFDAHLDVRDIEYGGPSNGTPMRNLIETGTIKGEDFVTIGLRSFANSKEYRTYAESKGMNLITAKDVKKRGMEEIIATSIMMLENKCDDIYVTLDIDVMDQSFVPGVPAIGPCGLSPDDIFYSLVELGKNKKVIGLDMVCVDPTKDVRDISSRVALHAFLHFATGYYKR